MLTFFDYLRERAREAVLAGVRDALEALEQPSIEPSESETKASFQFRRLTELGAESRSATEEKLPPPRKRRPGRPRKNPKAES